MKKRKWLIIGVLETFILSLIFVAFAQAQGNFRGNLDDNQVKIPITYRGMQKSITGDYLKSQMSSEAPAVHRSESDSILEVLNNVTYTSYAFFNKQKNMIVVPIDVRLKLIANKNVWGWVCTPAYENSVTEKMNDIKNAVERNGYRTLTTLLTYIEISASTPSGVGNQLYGSQRAMNTSSLIDLRYASTISVDIGYSPGFSNGSIYYNKSYSDEFARIASDFNESYNYPITDIEFVARVYISILVYKI